MCVCVYESLWLFQKIIFNYIYICLTWLGFGLTVAVLIMRSVLCYKINPFEWQHQLTATIYFYCFKLISKDPVWLEDGAQVSGFQESKVMKIPCRYKNRENLWDIFQGVDVCVATAKCWDDEIWYQKSLSQWNKMNLLKNKMLGSIQDLW